LHEYRFVLHNIEKDFLPRFKEFYTDVDLRTCKKCRHVMEADKRFM
jgi:3-hydroxyanthranilate 3,4-dioxygenase